MKWSWVPLLFIGATLWAQGTADGGTAAFQAFECVKKIEGKRSAGTVTVRFAPEGDGALLVLRFEALRPECAFTARWKTLRGPASCSASPLSPFAVLCAPRQLPFSDENRSYLYETFVRSSLRVEASGPAMRRIILFLGAPPSEDIIPIPPKSCEGLPIRRDPGASVGLQPWSANDFLSFPEAQCHLVGP